MQTMTAKYSPLFISNYKPHSLDGFFSSSKFKSVLRTLLEIDDINILFIGNTCSGKTILLHTLIREYYQLVSQQPLPDNNILYVNNLKVVSYTHLTLPTKRIV